MGNEIFSKIVNWKGEKKVQVENLVKLSSREQIDFLFNRPGCAEIA